MSNHAHFDSRASIAERGIQADGCALQTVKGCQSRRVSDELGNSLQAVIKPTAAACFSEVQVVDKKPTVRMLVG